MRQPETNVQQRARDASQLTFAPVGAPPRCAWAKAFYEAFTARGGRHQAALRALAFKWIRILYRCWVDRIPYDESRYLAALGKHADTHTKSLAVRLRA